MVVGPSLALTVFCHICVVCALGIHAVSRNVSKINHDPNNLVILDRSFPKDQKAKYAIVQPFWLDELPYLLQEKQGLKCPDITFPLDLILYYSGSEDDVDPNSMDTVGKILDSFVQKHKFGGCFQKLHVRYANISKITMGYDALCQQYMNIFSMSPPAWGYASFYWMEMDVRPLKLGWYNKLQVDFEQTADGDAWVIGGIYQKGCLDSAKTSDDFWGPTYENNYIARNAVYSTHPDYVQWLLTVEPSPCPLFPQVLTDLSRTNSTTADKYVDDMKFMDCKPFDLVELDRKARTKPKPITINTDLFTKRYPNAMLVHSTDKFSYPLEELKSKGPKGSQ